MLYCPSCKSDRVIKNGHTSNKKQQWICKNCNMRFLNNIEISKKYPHTSFPFPFIARMLYMRKYMKRKMNVKMSMKRFRKYVNYHIWYLDIKNKQNNTRDISRQTIHHWINTYDNKLESIISYDEANDFVENLRKNTYDSEFMNQRSMDIPVETIVFEKRKCKHIQALEILQKRLDGKEKSLECLRNDEKIFDVLLEEAKIFEIPKIKNIWTKST